MPSGELKSLLIFLYLIVLKSKTDKSDWFEKLAGVGGGETGSCDREWLGRGRVHP